MWLLFPFSRRFRLYDHAAFVTYSLCFVTLPMVILSLVKATGAHGTTAFGLFIIVPLHMYRQLREACALRWWSALLRTIMLLMFSMIAATLFTIALLALGVLG